jgi:hypothetical protein
LEGFDALRAHRDVVRVELAKFLRGELRGAVCADDDIVASMS